MGRQQRVLITNGFYHVYSRGVDKQTIFKDYEDFTIFFKLINSSSQKKDFKLHAYCLMHNHYHFLIQTPKANLSQIMHEVNFKYAKYFNKKYARKGILFESRFNSIVISKPLYALNLLRYIHLNPVDANLVKQAEYWQWSSYQYFLNQNSKPSFLDTEFFLNYFVQEDIKRFLRFHNDSKREEFHFML